MVHLVAIGLSSAVAGLHSYFLALEMFLWEKPLGLKTFRNTPQKAKETAVLAANQGLYNGILSAGLLWSAFGGLDAAHSRANLAFFNGAVVVAGVYGALTVSRKILYVQALPAAAALAATLLL
jgi:putative membrane protein